MYKLLKKPLLPGSNWYRKKPCRYNSIRFDKYRRLAHQIIFLSKILYDYCQNKKLRYE